MSAWTMYTALLAGNDSSRSALPTSFDAGAKLGQLEIQSLVAALQMMGGVDHGSAAAARAARINAALARRSEAATSAP